MKITKKLLATLLSATIFTTSFFAGGCSSAGLGEGAIEGRPNYDVSEGAKTYNIWTYGQTCSDHYFINSEIQYFLDENGNSYTMQTFERTQELLEANFNMVFLDYSHFGEGLLTTDEEWENLYIKRTLDYCYQLGLRVFAFGTFSYGLAQAVRAVDKHGEQHLSRIVPNVAQECIEEYYEEAFEVTKDREARRLIALNEQDNSITNGVIARVRDQIKFDLYLEALDMTFDSDEAKAEWYRVEGEKRLEETDINEIVMSEIDVRSNEYAEENKDEYAKWKYWTNDDYYCFFRSWDEYKEFIAESMNHIINHPAFFGYSLVDEPAYWTFPLVVETARAFKEVAAEVYGKENFHMMVNMLPPADTPSVKDAFCEGGSKMSVWTAYEQFLDHYKNNFLASGLFDFFQYDDYPVYNTGIRNTFLRGHQLTSEFARDNDIRSTIVMQSYGCDGTHRFNEYEDVLWQANIGAAFGKTEFSYYTWWPILNTTDGLLEDRTFPLTRFGERTELFYSIQKVNDELQYLGKYLTHFKYSDSTYLYKLPLPTSMGMIDGLKRPTEYTKLGDVEIDEETLAFLGQEGGLLIVTELYDAENDQKGYFVINGTDPGVPSEAVATLTFDGYNNVQIVRDKITTNVALKENKITIELGTGRGVFIMPY